MAALPDGNVPNQATCSGIFLQAYSVAAVPVLAELTKLHIHVAILQQTERPEFSAMIDT